MCFKMMKAYDQRNIMLPLIICLDSCWAKAIGKRVLSSSKSHCKKPHILIFIPVTWRFLILSQSLLKKNCCLVAKSYQTLLQLQGLQLARFFCPWEQEYWKGLPFPSPGDLLDLGIQSVSLALAGRLITTEQLDNFLKHNATAAKSLQSCPTLCDSRDDSPPGFPVPGILHCCPVNKFFSTIFLDSVYMY